MTSYSTLFIDLDQTVYPENSGIWEDVAERIHIFLQNKLNLKYQEAIDLRMRYYQQYGTTLRGLQKESDVDPISYMKFIHNVPIEEKINVDPGLPKFIQSINIPKYIFTNASVDHAVRVLRHLGVEKLFDGIIDIISLEFANKPDLLAYKRALRIAGNANAEDSILLDDSIKNLEAGPNSGFTTVHVGSIQETEFVPDFHIESIHGLFEVLPELHNSHLSGTANHG